MSLLLSYNRMGYFYKRSYEIYDRLHPEKWQEQCSKLVIQSHILSISLCRFCLQLKWYMNPNGRAEYTSNRVIWSTHSKQSFHFTLLSNKSFIWKNLRCTLSYRPTFGNIPDPLIHLNIVMVEIKLFLSLKQETTTSPLLL